MWRQLVATGQGSSKALVHYKAAIAEPARQLHEFHACAQQAQAEQDDIGASLCTLEAAEWGARTSAGSGDAIPGLERTCGGLVARGPHWRVIHARCLLAIEEIGVRTLTVERRQEVLSQARAILETAAAAPHAELAEVLRRQAE